MFIIEYINLYILFLGGSVFKSSCMQSFITNSVLLFLFTFSYTIEEPMLHSIILDNSFGQFTDQP